MRIICSIAFKFNFRAKGQHPAFNINQPESLPCVATGIFIASYTLSSFNASLNLRPMGKLVLLTSTSAELIFLI